MKILLLNPPTRDNKKFIREGRCTQEQGVWATLWPPVSLVTIGAVLEQDGHEVRIIDCPGRGMSWDGLREKIAAILPGLVIWSTGTPSIQNDLSLARVIKDIDGSITTAVFGTHVTALDRQCLESFPHLDVIIRHEPELTAQELARALHQGKSFADLQGISCRTPAGELRANPARPFIENLDTLPFPAWHCIPVDSYRLPMKGRPFLIIAPQRGCPFSCSFCTCQTYYGRRLRTRSIDSVMAELQYDMQRFAVSDFFFWAETFVIDRDYVARLCDAILERGLKISWTCNSRIDIVDDRLLGLMARAGCWMISFGIESADQAVLDRAGKGTKVEQARVAVQSARRAGVKTAGHFILGLPGDTPGSVAQTIALAKNIGLDIAQFYCCVPFPGSRLYEQALGEGWIGPQDFTCFNQAGAVMNLPTISPAEVNRARSRAYRSFYGRPAAWYRIAGMLGGGSMRALWKTLKDFMRWSGT